MSIRACSFVAFVAVLAGALLLAHAAEPPGEAGNLPAVRIQQEELAAGLVTLDDLRLMGLRLFTTPLNRLDGYGDGPMDPADVIAPGGRPTLQGNGTFLRVNGLDAQTCLECHSVVSAATTPPRLGIGGVGGSNSNAIIKPTSMDPANPDPSGKMTFNGRFANPPFLFGAGAVELLGLEMTADLQALARQARAAPGTDVDLVTKGVWFGVLRALPDGTLDTSGVQGVDPDLVVKPFGRKGEFPTVRAFDVEAVQFHFGMQPMEVVGEEDEDGDGVAPELTVGDLSAFHAFGTTLERPFQERLDEQARRGFDLFVELGCSECHRPSLETERRELPLRFPEVATEPWANAFLAVDLTRAPMRFDRVRKGSGVVVPLFADLKRHDMGPALAEDFALVTPQRNREFTTARLWGVADTAPYLHDGRATTLTEAILLHGGEAQDARDGFAALGDEDRMAVLAFLRTLRTPTDPASDLAKRAEQASRKEAQRERKGDKRKSIRGD